MKIIWNISDLEGLKSVYFLNENIVYMWNNLAFSCGIMMKRLCETSLFLAVRNNIAEMEHYVTLKTPTSSITFVLALSSV